MKKTKIVCTIGPASDSEEVLRELFKEGLNVCRLNFSHGTHEEHQIRIDRIKKIRQELNLPIAIMLDTKGPEIRLKNFGVNSVMLSKGQQFTLTTRDILGDEKICSVTYTNLAKEVKPNDRILIDDGLIELRVEKVTDGTDIVCTVMSDGPVSNHKGINIPGVKIKLPFLSEQDISDLKFGVKNEVDFVAASFTRGPADILSIRKVLEEENGNNIHIIAKIENQEGVDSIDKILEVTDGIMVARGDLGIEIPPEQIPMVQKMIIRKTLRASKPVITATQMLDSMTHNPRPTRAEVTDVANAIFDGTSAIMLSGETAAGRYPVETVKMMNRIAVTAEGSLNYEKIVGAVAREHSLTITNAIAHATCSMAIEMNAQVIVTATASGETPRALSKYKPKAPIVAVTPSEETARRLSLNWDVYPIVTPYFNSTDEMFERCINLAKEHGYVREGELAVLTAGVPIGLVGSTNLLKVETVGKILLKGKGTGIHSVVTGRVKVIRTEQDLLTDFADGDIIVTESTNDLMNSFIERAGAVITENGNLSGHAAMMGLNLSKPTIVGAKEATSVLHNGDIITLNGKTGVVVKGTAVIY
nr:pyruvate kinase [uncultured Treponema sp.]